MEGSVKARLTLLWGENMVSQFLMRLPCPAVIVGKKNTNCYNTLDRKRYIKQKNNV